MFIKFKIDSLNLNRRIFALDFATKSLLRGPCLKFTFLFEVELILTLVETTGYLWFLSGILALRFHDEDHANLLNSMWLTAITFLCVGYGDIVPNTYCGRGITLTCGMVVCMNT